jgi:hypothetical protein
MADDESDETELGHQFDSFRYPNRRCVSRATTLWMQDFKHNFAHLGCARLLLNGDTPRLNLFPPDLAGVAET